MFEHYKIQSFTDEDLINAYFSDYSVFEAFCRKYEIDTEDLYFHLQRLNLIDMEKLHETLQNEK